MLQTMAIECPCPGCGVVLGVSDEHAGKQARCPECAALFVVPKTSEIQTTSPPFVDSPQTAPSTADAVQADAAAETTAVAPEVEETPLAIAPPPDHRQWWLKTPQGAVYGPISKEQLDCWCEEGRVADDCHVKHEEEHAWREAAEEYPVLVQKEPPVAAFAAPQGVAETRTAVGPEVSLSPTASARPTVLLPHRGVIISALGFASWITLCCPVFGVIAWNMGNRDLELMYSGQMDASGMRMTHLGRLIGLLHVLTFVTALILSLAFAVIYLVMQ
jgi:hypothetical protein